MIVLLSPSKTLDYESKPATNKYTQPRFLDKTQELVDVMKRYSVERIEEFMNVSKPIAELNRKRYQQFSIPFTAENARQAILAFKGDVYRDIDVAHYSEKDFAYAQQHVRTLSGLYGLLRPLDLIQPYRLEMHLKLKTQHAADLYTFWKALVTEQLNDDVSEEGSGVVVNLASQEYFKAVDRNKLAARVVTPVFKEFKNGDYQVIAIYAKKARGTMTNYMVKNALTDARQLKEFAEDGYRFDASRSSEDEWVFTRKA